MKDLSKISVVLPSLDPDEKLIAVVDGLLEYGFSDIILVNDAASRKICTISMIWLPSIPKFICCTTR